MDKTASYHVSIIITLLVLFGLSVFFALCETSFSSLNRIKLKNMAEKDRLSKNSSLRRRSVRARLVLKLLDAYDKLLSSVLIGNTIVNVVTSALATMLCFELFGPKGVSIAAVAVTVSVLIFGEISPKTLAKEIPELTALWAAPLLRFFTIIFAPINYLASAWRNIIIKIFPVKADRSVTEEELLTIVQEMRQEGGINSNEEEMIRQAIEFDDLTAAQICTPRMDIAAVNENDSPAVIDAKFAETGFSRLPVFRETIDYITGLLLLKDFHHEVINGGKSVASIVKPVVTVTKTIKISRLLRTLQNKRTHMAVVVDEFGSTLGIVTIEDIMEELVGEIWDEHDEVEEPITGISGGAYMVMGNFSLPAMFDFIHEELHKDPEGSTGDAAAEENTPDEQAVPDISVGSWALEKLGALPKVGDVFTSHGLHVTVAKVQRRRVLKAIIKPVSG